MSQTFPMSTPAQPTVPSAPGASPNGGLGSSGGWLSSQSIFAEPDPRQRKRTAGAMVAAIGLHALFLFLAFAAFTYTADQLADTAVAPLTRVIYLQQVGPGGEAVAVPLPRHRSPSRFPRVRRRIPFPSCPWFRPLCRHRQGSWRRS